MKLPQWFKRKPAAPGKPLEPETVEQAETKLEQARADLVVAERQVDEARAKLDNERTDDVLETLRAAKTNAEDLAELVKLVEQDLEAAKARAEAARRAELERQLAVARSEINARQDTAGVLEQAELDAWIAAVDARSARLAHADTTLELEGQAKVIAKSLGLNTSSEARDRGSDRTRLWHVRMAERLEGLGGSGESFDLKRAIVRMLVPNFDNQPRR